MISIKNSKKFVVFTNAFTPNQDGFNDFFRPKTSNISQFHMSIYNQWGQFLFETNNLETGWNGFMNGVKCPSGLYVYLVSYIFQDAAETKTKRGSFTLIE
ncbi:MAG: gliding motility-associated C-terminal domain-containing protein [Bacteroidales bacterium]|nr:gliding motility-associated C-terminal domain-containing protein [Bacteroidales bacterium]